MFTAQGNRGRCGFSLVELLTAVAVAALVVPAIIAVIPRAFAALSSASGVARAARATAAFDSEFDHDFSAIVRECGFEGDGSRCSFWTMRPAQDAAFMPALVEYRREPGRVVRAEFPLPLYVALAGTNAPSATPPSTDGAAPSLRPDTTAFEVDASLFRYADLSMPDGDAADEWSSPTNAPASVEMKISAPGGDPLPRLFFRRTAQ